MAKVFLDFLGVKEDGQVIEANGIINIPFKNKDVYTEKCFKYILETLMKEQDLKSCTLRTAILLKIKGEEDYELSRL